MVSLPPRNPNPMHDMQLPSLWQQALPEVLAAYPDMRAVVYAAIDRFDVTRFDREVHILLTRLAASPQCSEALAEEADHFGNAQWYNYATFNTQVAGMTPAQFADFVCEKFATHCQGKPALLVEVLYDADWQLVIALHYVYMLFSLYDKARCRADFGIESTRRRELRFSKKPLARVLSRCI